MKKSWINIIIIVGVLAAVGAGSFLVFQKKPLPSTADLAMNTLYNSLENFIKQSAQEISDPLYAPAVPAGQSDNKEDPGVKKESDVKNPPEKKAPASPTPNAFKCGNGPDFLCYEEYYRDITKNKGVKAAFADLKLRYDSVPYMPSLCHPLTHIIGQEAVTIYANVSEAYTNGDTFCWSGYYHGVLEGVASKIGKDNLVASLNDICKDIPGKETYSFNYYNCIHGLGHGLMAMTENELFESLAFCDNLEGSWERQSCYGGVFMENVIVDNKNHFTKYLKPSDPLYPCNAVSDAYKGTCYLMQTSYMLKVTNKDFSRVFQLCSQVEDNYRSLCYQSLGRDASGQSSSNVQITKATCDLGDSYEQKSHCIIGAVKDFISYYHSQTQAEQLCDLLDVNLQDICHATKTDYYQTFQ